MWGPRRETASEKGLDPGAAPALSSPTMARRMVVLKTDGTRLRGYAHDFFPGKAVFHFNEVDPSGEPGVSHAVDLEDVHAVFFVRDFGFERSNRYTDDTAPAQPAEPPTAGSKRLRVTCVWGEVMEGLTYGWEPNRPGFFLFPTDPRERVYNLERAFLTRQAIQAVEQTAAA